MTHTTQEQIRDGLILFFDQQLKTLSDINKGTMLKTRPVPQPPSEPTSALSETERKHVAGLMRVNHAGEVCAQALYQGQAITARDPTLQRAFKTAAQEEYDHLAWCQSRLTALKSHTSYFNGIWYLGALGMGLGAGALGDYWSLGFLAETEKQVISHLKKHLAQVPVGDLQTQAILKQMIIEEAEHQKNAVLQGAYPLPNGVKRLMQWLSSMMVTIAYYY